MESSQGMEHPMGRAGGAGYLGDSHCIGEGTFPHPVSSVPTKLRAEHFSTALQTPSPGSASRHTRLGKTDPHLVWKGDGGLPGTALTCSTSDGQALNASPGSRPAILT